MSKEKTYSALARLIEYPVDKEALLADVGEVSEHLDEQGLPAAALPFADFLIKSPSPGCRRITSPASTSTPPKPRTLGTTSTVTTRKRRPT